MTREERKFRKVGQKAKENANKGRNGATKTNGYAGYDVISKQGEASGKIDLGERIYQVVKGQDVYRTYKQYDEAVELAEEAGSSAPKGVLRICELDANGKVKKDLGDAYTLMHAEQFGVQRPEMLPKKSEKPAPKAAADADGESEVVAEQGGAEPEAETQAHEKGTDSAPSNQKEIAQAATVQALESLHAYISGESPKKKKPSKAEKRENALWEGLGFENPNAESSKTLQERAEAATKKILEFTGKAKESNCATPRLEDHSAAKSGKGKGKGKNPNPDPDTPAPQPTDSRAEDADKIVLTREELSRIVTDAVHKAGKAQPQSQTQPQPQQNQQSGSNNGSNSKGTGKSQPKGNAKPATQQTAQPAKSAPQSTQPQPEPKVEPLKLEELGIAYTVSDRLKAKAKSLYELELNDDGTFGLTAYKTAEQAKLQAVREKGGTMTEDDFAVGVEALMREIEAEKAYYYEAASAAIAAAQAAK